MEPHIHFGEGYVGVTEHKKMEADVKTTGCGNWACNSVSMKKMCEEFARLCDSHKKTSGYKEGGLAMCRGLLETYGGRTQKKYESAWLACGGTSDTVPQPDGSESDDA